MTTALFLACGMLAQAAPDDTRLAYDREKVAAGRDPAAHVRLALWCEAHDLPAERVKHLALAVLNDPANAVARGLMGLVAYGGRWQRPDAVGEKVKDDARLTAALAEYNGRRDRTPETADAQWRLALWCEENGLKPEALAHLASVVRLEPGRDAAWKRLGYKKVNGRWATDAQVAAEKAEFEARRKADKHWAPLLARWRSGLADPKQRDEAERAIASVTDPYAAPAVWAVFVEGARSERDQATAVQLLGQIDAPRASKSLAMLAVFSDSPEVRRAATETLRNRDNRDFLGTLIPLLRKRVKYEIRPVGGPGSPGVLFVEGEQFNVRRLYAPPPMPNIPLYFGENVTYDQYGLPVISRYEGWSFATETSTQSDTVTGGTPKWALDIARKEGTNPLRTTRPSSLTTTTTTTTRTPIDHSVQIPIGQLMLQYQTAAVVALRQQADDVQVVKDYNRVVGRVNDRVSQVLSGATGASLGDDAEAWTKWWVDQLGYAYKAPEPTPVPTYVENVPLAYVPPGVPTVSSSAPGGPPSTSVTVTKSFTPGGGHSCFAAGTAVRTLVGQRPIESVKVGDRLLSQDVRSGALSYQPVLAVFHNRPASTLRIDLGGETVVATPIHRFWKAGQGWVMARDLKAGDPVRTLDGTARVRSVADDEVQPVFNLQVAEGNSFFVGGSGTLVHDNSLVEPAPAPFDAPASVATYASPGSR